MFFLTTSITSGKARDSQKICKEKVAQVEKETPFC
jgi:hypothetical protein